MKYTINEFEAQYPNNDACLDALFSQKFGLLKECPKCNNPANFKRVKGHKSYQCTVFFFIPDKYIIFVKGKAPIGVDALKIVFYPFSN